MKRIERVSIIGMGALGILYGSFFAERLGKDHVTFLVDKERLKRYEGVEVTCNGKPWSFRVKDGALPSEKGPAQLLIFAVKATAFPPP